MSVKQKEYIKMLTQLFVVFVKLGPSTFGGGYAMITAIEREIVDKKAWLKPNEVGDMVSVSASAPGGVVVNSAAFVGYRLAGILGAIISVIAITLPTFLIVLSLSILGMMFQDVSKVNAALKGVHAAVVALIIVAAFKVGKTSIMDSSTLFIAGLSTFLLLFTSLHSLYLILGGPIVGVTIISIKRALGLSAPTEKEEESHQSELNYPEYYI
ncbi:chromate transporter [Paenibacillus sp. QZ-Y1]|uniref:chromate transporter n=1 Tax=Paenibacillus sp. QZ-Y1 TaxID=3414511 RepID=UPI003F7A6672